MKRTPDLREEQILNIWVQPRASRNEILGFREGYLHIRVTAAPTEGEANHLCRQVLAEALGISPSRVEILSGHKTRRKRMRVRGVEAKRLQALGENRGQR